MITARNLTKKYDKGNHRVVVLDHADLTIESGEFVMVLGESGTGKTTLLNFLGALDRPDEGEIVVDGTGDILKLGDGELCVYRNRVVGHIFQTFNLKPTYTSYENVRIPLLFTRLSRGEQREMIGESLKAVGLWDRRDFKPVELSEGQCQRVAIARAIVNKPKMLLADEPTGNLDPKTARKIMDLLVRLNREMKMTLVMVTHDMRLLEYADKVLRLAGGKVNEETAESGRADAGAKVKGK